MNVFETISKLRVVRKYQDKGVDEKVVGLILYSATHAISAGNLQPWEFIVVDNFEIKKKLAHAALKLEHVAKAPLCIIVGTDLQKVALKYGKRGELIYAIEDAVQASQIILLTATALGLGGDLIRAFDEEEVKAIIGFPDNVRPVAIITLGYPAEEGEERQKIPFENLTYMNRYGNELRLENETLQGILDKTFAELKKRTSQKLKKRFNIRFLKSH